MTTYTTWRRRHRTVGLWAAGCALAGWVNLGAWAQEEKTPQPPPPEKKADADKEAGDEKSEKAKEGLVPIDLKLPKPVFKGTPKNAPPGANLEEPRKGPRPPFPAPKGVTNVALNKLVRSSDEEPIIGEIAFVTDGNKDATEGSYVELGPGAQYVQIDLKKPHVLYAIVVWHYHSNARIYHDVVVQVADDEDFITHVHTVFNNDHDNSSGLGLGEQKEYWETYEGKLIEVDARKARYVRLYSNGSLADDQNHYTEVEVFGLPVD